MSVRVKECDGGMEKGCSLTFCKRNTTLLSRNVSARTHRPVWMNAEIKHPVSTLQTEGYLHKIYIILNGFAISHHFISILNTYL